VKTAPAHVGNASLEPDPSWFGNKPNEVSNPTWTNKNWLKSRFHFSFAEYSNPRNTGFGILRVMNDDLVQPNRGESMRPSYALFGFVQIHIGCTVVCSSGFGAHPHRDTEICTYVVHGQLTHQDSMGTSETLGRGAIQFMVTS
jgi:redox-sensitive bicupin YhaK (pirin superfamily)